MERLRTIVNKLKRWIIEKLGGAVWEPEKAIKEVFRGPAVRLKARVDYSGDTISYLGEQIEEVAFERLSQRLVKDIFESKLYELHTIDSERWDGRAYEMEVWVVPPKGVIGGEARSDCQKHVSAEL